MIDLSLSWGLTIDGGCSAGSIRSVEWHSVETKLDEVCSSGGSVQLELEEDHETGPHSLEVLVENGFFLLSLLEYFPDSTNVRSYTNPTGVGKMIEIGGNFWSDLLLCSNFSIVKNAFVEFYQTGDVSKQILS